MNDLNLTESQTEIVNAAMRAVRDALRQGVKVAAVRVHPETARALVALSDPSAYPEMTVWGLPVVLDGNLLLGDIAIDPVKVVTQADMDFDALRKFAGELVTDALGWPGVAYLRVRLSLHETWESPGGMAVVHFADRPQIGLQFTLKAIAETPNLIATLRRQFDDARREQAEEATDGQ